MFPSHDPAASIAATGTWSTGGTMNLARRDAGADGTQTAAWIAGGYDAVGPGNAAEHEQYDGTSWSEEADINTDRYSQTGAGTTTAAIIVSGQPGSPYTVLTGSWNGSSWTEVAESNSTINYRAGGGTQTAALVAGGQPPPSTNVESWNGSAWSETTEINNTRFGAAGAGTQTAMIIASGQPSDRNL